MKNIKENLKANLNKLDYLEKTLTLQVNNFLKKNKNLQDFYKRIEIPNIIGKFPKVVVLKLVEEEGSYNFEKVLKLIRKTRKEVKEFMMSLKEVTSYISLANDIKDELIYEEFISEEKEKTKKPKQKQSFKKPKQDHSKSCSMLELAHIESKLTRIFVGVERLNKDDFDKLLERKKTLNKNIKIKMQK